MIRFFVVACALNFLMIDPAARAGAPVTIGSKIFSESSILAEIAAQTLEAKGMAVNRQLGLGSTGILLESLRTGAIDVYPDYSGTLAEALLKDKNLKSLPAIRAKLAPLGLTISDSLGFNNTYTLAVTAKFARAHSLKTMSDLAALKRPLRAAFSYEFMDRADGFRGMQAAYRFPFDPAHLRRMEHSLVYRAIESGEVDLIEVYATDANLKKYDLVTLADDKSYFPSYEAVLVANAAFVRNQPAAWAALEGLAGSISPAEIIDLNEEADVRLLAPRAVAASFLRREPAETETVLGQVGERTKEHLVLVGIAVLFSALIGIPLGILAARFRVFGNWLVGFASLVQTIPSLALLCFLIPLFGIGPGPAIIALCLYSLLPVILNTSTGISSIDPKHFENARAFGMNRREILRHVTLPLASPMILAGVKTAAIVSIGTATLAAFVGAGGYGALIISGLSLNDTRTILTGAVPAALMAVVANLLLDWSSVLVVPRFLRR